ncbi:MAG: hypothetical protein ACOCX8_01130 [Bacteroidota bacterium]
MLLLLLAFLVIYAVAPIYKFNDYQPFRGDYIYNPYQNMDSTAWKKGNFQVQSRAWWGITAGRGNSNEAIQTIYRQLGYDIIVTSDYMRINTFGKRSANYIPTYEHGYGIQKTHQVCLGSDQVCWLDYPFYQNRNHKQHIINLLRDDNKLIALAHPRLRSGYTLEEMQYITDYDLIEVLNEIKFSVGYWDAALSSGHPAYIIANDDAHDIFDPTEVGRICTFINTNSLNASSVLDALKSGKAYGANIAMNPGAEFVQKTLDHQQIPHVNHVRVVNDTLRVGVSRQAKLISFIGQNGVVKKTVTDTSAAFYGIMPIDTYIRTEIKFHNGTTFYLNPVIRTNGQVPTMPAPPQVDHAKTWIQRVIALIIAIFILVLVIRIRKRRRIKNRIKRRYYYYS